MNLNDERNPYDSLAATYGGEILDDATLADLGEPDEEQAFEDVVGITDEDGR
jgi:hypothetical protein